MSSVLERAKAHYASMGVQSLEVPEWGDDSGPLTVYWTPFTVFEQRTIFRKAQDGDVSALVDVVIQKAQDADGERLFTKADKEHLMRGVSSDVLTRIATAIVGGGDSVEDAAGN